MHSLASRIFKLVKESPGTAPEIGAIVFPKLPMRAGMRRASAHLCNLKRRGKVKVIGTVPRDGKRDSDPIRANLYAAIGP